MTPTTLPRATLRFPISDPPEFGTPVEVAPGILWLRLPLPFRLNHVNVYLLEDDNGFAIIDTGIGNGETRQLWEQVLARLGSPAITRVIATHFHSDHLGMAGWLCEQSGARLHMSHSEYFISLVFRLDPAMLGSEPYKSFYLGHGLAPDVTEDLLARGHRYLDMISGLPRTFRRLVEGEFIIIGGRRWEVLTGGGHSEEQIMLYCREEQIFLAADQIMARISPNISVQAMDPEGDPLGAYIRSLRALKHIVPDDALVLPGHHLPFCGLPVRADELLHHHAGRCQAILTACMSAERTVAELVPVVFQRPIGDPHQMGFAFSEALAHVNYLVREGRLLCRSGHYLAA